MKTAALGLMIMILLATTAALGEAMEIVRDIAEDNGVGTPNAGNTQVVVVRMGRGKAIDSVLYVKVFVKLREAFTDGTR